MRQDVNLVHNDEKHNCSQSSNRIPVWLKREITLARFVGEPKSRMKQSLGVRKADIGGALDISSEVCFSSI